MLSAFVGDIRNRRDKIKSKVCLFVCLFVFTMDYYSYSPCFYLLYFSWDKTLCITQSNALHVLEQKDIALHRLAFYFQDRK